MFFYIHIGRPFFKAWLWPRYPNNMPEVWIPGEPEELYPFTDIQISTLASYTLLNTNEIHLIMDKIGAYIKNRTKMGHRKITVFSLSLLCVVVADSAPPTLAFSLMSFSLAREPSLGSPLRTEMAENQRRRPNFHLSRKRIPKQNPRTSFPGRKRIENPPKPLAAVSDGRVPVLRLNEASSLLFIVEIIGLDTLGRLLVRHLLVGVLGIGGVGGVLGGAGALLGGGTLASGGRAWGVEAASRSGGGRSRGRRVGAEKLLLGLVPGLAPHETQLLVMYTRKGGKLRGGGVGSETSRAFNCARVFM